MEKIVYDLTSAQPNYDIKVNGGGEYACRLFQILVQMNKYDITVMLSKNKGEICDCSMAEPLLKINKYYYESLDDMALFINNSECSAVFFPVCYPEYGKIKIDRNKLVVSTVHDLSSIYTDHVNNKERYIGLNIRNRIYEYIKYYVFHNKVARKHIEDHKKILSISDNQLIVTDSQYSKYAMQYYLNIKEQSIAVCYPLSNMEFTDNIKMEYTLFERYNIIEEQFYLLVSCNRWHKNTYFSIMVIDSMIQEGKWREKYKVVLTGVDSSHKKFYQKKIKNLEYFVFLEYVEAGVLQQLYAGAKALIYSSLYEGFGYPPLEAMKYGTQVLASTATSIPEVCGNAAKYFDPTNREQLAVILLESFDSSRDDVKMSLQEHYQLIKKKQDKDINILLTLIEEKIRENRNE